MLLRRRPASRSPLSLLPLLLATLLLSLVHADAARAQGFAAAFELEIISGGAHTKSAGSLELLDGSHLFLDVTQPLHQQIWYREGALTLVYPDEKIVMEGKIPPAGSPLAFDSLVFATLRLGDTATEMAHLKETTSTPEGKLRQRWEIRTPKGKPAGEIHVQEGPGGIEIVAVVDEEGITRRRYRFGPRSAVGALSVPERIDGEYYDDEGKALRAERWHLSKLSPLPSEETRQAGKAPTIPEGATVKALTW